MTRLELLKKEKEIVKNLRTLSFDCIDECVEYFDYEIECIEVYGSANPECKERQTISNADYDRIADNISTMVEQSEYTLDEIAEVLDQMRKESE